MKTLMIWLALLAGCFSQVYVDSSGRYLVCVTCCSSPVGPCTTTCAPGG